MFAECNKESFGFHALGRRDVVARFDGGRISSDAGGTPKLQNVLAYRPEVSTTTPRATR